MGEHLTKRQREILDFINDFSRAKGYAPSYREIGEEFGLSSPATVHAHVQTLKEKGFVKISHNEARSIEVVADNNFFPEVNLAEAIELPLAGLITAGEPIEAVEEKEKIAVPANLVRKPLESYVLKVKGESMIDEGILSGDYVVVEKNPSPANGEIVVALLNGDSATLKKFYKEKNKIRLQPANKKMKPIYAREVAVQGVVRGLIRSFGK